MSSKQYDTQKDTTSTSLKITEEIKRKYEVQRSDVDINWGDYYRQEDQREDDKEAGFISEIAIADMLERLAGKENVEYGGDKGEADIVLFDQIQIEVKARQDKTEYRNLVINKDHKHSNVDLYIHSVVNRDMFSDEPVSVEILGYIEKDKAVRKGEEVSFFSGNNEGDKLEVHPHHLENIEEIKKIVRMFK